MLNDWLFFFPPRKLNLVDLVNKALEEAMSRKRKMYESHSFKVWQVEESLQDMGFKVLGSGCFGLVFEHDGKAYKICKGEDAGYRAFLDICEAHPSAYLPEIYSVEELNGDCLLVEMEILSPYEPELDNDGCINADYDAAKRLLSCMNTIASDELIEVCDILLAHKTGITRTTDDDLCNDLHGQNVMVRNGDQLVITDPWC